MSKEKLLNNVFQWGVMTAIVAVALPDLAIAQQSVGQAINQFRTADATSAPPIINAIAYIGGAVLGISGALKLKAHAENPAQEKMAPGIARLLAGGGLAILPSLISTMSQTTHLQGQATFNPLANIQ